MTQIQGVRIYHGFPDIKDNDASVKNSKIAYIFANKMHHYHLLIKTWFLNGKKIQLFWKSRQIFFAEVLVSKRERVTIQQEEIVGIDRIIEKNNIDIIKFYFRNTYIKLIPLDNSCLKLYIYHTGVGGGMFNVLRPFFKKIVEKS